MSNRDPGVLRALARKDESFALAAERLFRLSPGGSPENPLTLRSASQVEVHAEGTPCAICHGEQIVEDHTAERFAGHRLRVARVRCKHCGAGRAIYFRIGAALPS